MDGPAPLRIVAALLVAAVGAIHLYLYFDYFSRISTIGPLFVANFAAGVVLGVLILVSRGRVWPLAGAVFCAATLGAFLISVHWGLFSYHERLHGSWQYRAAVTEVAGALVCLAAAARSGRNVSARAPAG